MWWGPWELYSYQDAGFRSGSGPVSRWASVRDPEGMAGTRGALPPHSTQRPSFPSVNGSDPDRIGTETDKLVGFGL